MSLFIIIPYLALFGVATWLLIGEMGRGGASFLEKWAAFLICLFCIGIAFFIMGG